MYSRLVPPSAPKQQAGLAFPLRVASRAPAWVLAFTVSIVVLVAATGLDFLLEQRSRSFLSNIDGSAVLAALVAGLLFYRMLWYERQRRRAIRQRLEIIAEMNHHVRNAIHTIMLSAHVPQDKNVVTAIDESVQRIDWALKEILPKL
jgi:hypothetical protein